MYIFLLYSYLMRNFIFVCTIKFVYFTIFGLQAYIQARRDVANDQPCVLLYVMRYDIFVNCNWVATRWQ